MLKKENRYGLAKKPAATVSLRAFDICDDATMPVICPTCQTLSKIERTRFGRSKPILQLVLKKRKCPLPSSGAGRIILAMMSICA
jgi:hypothetical protein